MLSRIKQAKREADGANAQSLTSSFGSAATSQLFHSMLDFALGGSALSCMILMWASFNSRNASSMLERALDPKY
ncbi:hypothetical protein CT676_38250 [Bradyrhizobium sp. MOS001]|uniref:hypothetical protein n=1 Tax=Bradyrhizobium sp. MOS001 TaxID=2133948 RepID=UPI001075290B|nr:hypothetical protein [Bradyrhizobium sp. MOS001]TFW55904.1 hypothetical protein CT676_38250 [Bradyrhizobium sp. MOS001]